MKRFTYCLLGSSFFLISLMSLPCAAQPAYQWGFSNGGVTGGSDQGYSLALDASGNVYGTGCFYFTPDFDPGIGTTALTSAGLSDVYLAMYNSSGVYQWALGMGGTGYDEGRAIITDASGNFFLTGIFESTADFDPFAGTAGLTSKGGQDVFLAKYNSSGVYQWAIGMGGTGNEEGRAVALGPSGDLYVTGKYSATADFDPGAGTANLTASGTCDIFLAKYSSAGAYQWAFSLGGSGDDRGFDLSTDPSGNVYVTGWCTGTSDFDPGAGTSTLTASGNYDMFLASYTASGLYQWAFRVGGSSNDFGYGITIDGANNLYVTGGYNATADFDPGAGTANITSTGGQQAYIAKYDAAGSYQWAFAFGSTSASGTVQGNKINLDTDNSIYVSGTFSGCNVDCDPGAGTAMVSIVGATDAYFAKYNSSGTYQWAFKIGSIGSDYGNDIAIDASCNVAVTGFLGGPADFDPGPATVTMTAGSGGDFYFAQYAGGCAILPSGLVLFEGKNENESNILLWQTAGERNNAYFIVEHGIDGRSFKPIGSLRGAGNSGVNRYYSFTHHEPSPGMNYYRLQQVDFDGKFTYSEVVSIDIPVFPPAISLFPNPAEKQLNCVISSDHNTIISASVIDMLGNTVLGERRRISHGKNNLIFDIGGLPRGVYFLLVGSEGQQKQVQFVKE